MECLLLGGSYSVGKSESIYRLANHLILNGFTDVTGTVPTLFTDFRAVLEGKNKLGENIRIIINSPTDTVKIIDEFKAFYDLNGTYDILISSVRDDNFWPRQDFFTIMNISSPKDFILELPLAKILRQGPNFTMALNWYQNQIDNTLHFILANSPYNLL